MIYPTICFKLPASDYPLLAEGSSIMVPIVRALLVFAVRVVRSRVSLQAEIVALRHQLRVYESDSNDDQE